MSLKAPGTRSSENNIDIINGNHPWRRWPHGNGRKAMGALEKRVKEESHNVYMLALIYVLANLCMQIVPILYIVKPETRRICKPGLCDGYYQVLNQALQGRNVAMSTNSNLCFSFLPFRRSYSDNLFRTHFMRFNTRICCDLPTHVNSA